MKAFGRSLVLFIASITFSLAIGEFAARNFFIVRNVGPSFTTYDSTYGKWHKKDFTCFRTTPWFTMKFTTNSMGSRTPEPPRFPRHGILFLGDSYTEGYGVNDDEVFAELIRVRMNERYGEDSIPVVNFGTGDNGNGMWLKFLRNRGEEFAPRLIVLQLMQNDFEDNLNERLFSPGPGGSLIEHAPPARSGARQLQKMIESVPGLSYSYLVSLFRQSAWVLQRNDAELPQPDEQKDALTFRIIDNILARCNEEHWPVIVLEIGFEPGRFEKLKAIAARHHAPVIRAHTRQDRPDMVYEYDNHWNAKGHRAAADEVLAVIDSMGTFSQ